MTKAALVLCLLSGLASAQAPAFEVASVKLANPGVKGSDIHRDPGGGLVATNIDLRSLIILSYQLQPFQLSGGPGWISSDRWDIEGKAPAGTPKSKTWDMLQTLLADRFQLVVRRETKDAPVFAMAAAKSGFKLQASTKPPNEADGSVNWGTGRIRCQKVTMADVAMVLSGTVGRQVIDQTGIAGKFDFTLTWTPDNYRPGADGAPAAKKEGGIDPDGPTIFTALQEQLGLKLETSHGPVEVVVIEKAEHPSGN